jgi:hypothetical protein
MKKKIFSFEMYLIMNGTWTLLRNFRCDINEKRKQVAYLKNKGYVYDRKEKAYFLRNVGTAYNCAVSIKSYEM